MNAPKARMLIFESVTAASRWKHTLTGIIIIIVIFAILGVAGQVYISWPGRSSADQEAFERSVEFWLGDNGIIFSLLICVGVPILVFFIRELLQWINQTDPRLRRLEVDTLDTLGDVRTAANAIAKLSDVLRTELVPDIRKNLDKEAGNLISSLTGGVKNAVLSGIQAAK